jgi:hypothetical protein
MCKCGHEKLRHKFKAWMTGACLDCGCDDYEASAA